MSATYKYPRPALTTDCVLFGLAEDDLQVLLIERANAPFQGKWALPGGFAEVGEPLEETARRELCEETGLADIALEQLHTFSDPERDPREHVVTVAYYALVNLAEQQAQAASDARRAAWFRLAEIPPLAFDHDLILQTALARLRAKTVVQPIGLELLPETFPLQQLQRLYEAILARPLDPHLFREKLLATGILEALAGSEYADDPGAARLYRFDRAQYAAKLNAGFVLELCLRGGPPSALL